MQYKKVVLTHDNPKMWSKIKAAVGKVKTATHPKVSTGNILNFRNILFDFL